MLFRLRSAVSQENRNELPRQASELHGYQASYDPCLVLVAKPAGIAMNSRTRKKWLMATLVALIAGILFTVGLRGWHRSEAAAYRTFTSPDKRFQIIVFRDPAIFAMPGHGSDASGYFQLRDTRTGEVLRESKVEMVQLVDRVDWSSTTVDVRLLAEWSLPQ